MKRPLATILISFSLSLSLAACDGGSEPEPTRPGGTTVASPGAPGSPDGPSLPPIPGGENLPSPSFPGEGKESTRARFRVEGSAVDQALEELPPPGVVLARTAQEAQQRAGSVPGRARDLLLGWDYRSRALIVVLGGSQPDESYRLGVETVALAQGGKILSVSGSLQRGKQARAGSFTPWVAVSLPLPNVVLVEKCQIALQGQSTRQSGCR